MTLPHNPGAPGPDSRTRDRKVTAAVALLFMAAITSAQAPSGVPVTITSATFHFERPELKPPSWSIQLSAEGTGTYITAPETTTNIKISPETWRRLTTPLDTVKSTHCETKVKNIAKTGAKRITYKLADGTQAECEFNYSDADSLNEAAGTFQSIATTLQYGEELRHTLRYDRLGLDAEIDSLLEEAKSGRAIEIQNIAPILKSIQDDERVMERVRRKAARALLDAGIPNPTK